MFLISFAPTSLDAHLVRDTSVGDVKRLPGQVTNVMSIRCKVSRRQDDCVSTKFLEV